jgi:hypothetical protein
MRPAPSTAPCGLRRKPAGSSQTGVDPPATLTWWADAPSATRFAYAAGTHQQAVRGMRAGGWARETWFGRFTIADARGTWHGTSLPVSATGAR